MKKARIIPRFSVELPGFEPRMTGPESVVLPLHHSPMLLPESGTKISLNFYSPNIFGKKLLKYILCITKYFKNFIYLQ